MPRVRNGASLSADRRRAKNRSTREEYEQMKPLKDFHWETQREKEKKQIASIHRRPNKTRQLRRDKGECSKSRSHAISATTVHRYVRRWFLRYDSETNLW